MSEWNPDSYIIKHPLFQPSCPTQTGFFLWVDHRRMLQQNIYLTVRRQLFIPTNQESHLISKRVKGQHGYKYILGWSILLFKFIKPTVLSRAKHWLCLCGVALLMASSLLNCIEIIDRSEAPLLSNEWRLQDTDSCMLRKKGTVPHHCCGTLKYISFIPLVCICYIERCIQCIFKALL